MSCLVCTRPLPELAVKYEDEFCSSTCARDFHGCPLERQRQAVLGEAASARSGEAVRVASSPSAADEFYDLELLAQLEDEAA